MTQVNFYKLKSGETQSRLQFVCRLTEKAFSLGHRIHIQVDNEQQSKQLDDLLWQYSASSFLPHGSESSAADEPITIGSKMGADSNADVLINLGSQPCQLEGRFSRINEVIGSDQESIELGRKRYRFYQEKDYRIEYHEL